jgi:hypothetical protein
MRRYAELSYVPEKIVFGDSYIYSCEMFPFRFM